MIVFEFGNKEQVLAIWAMMARRRFGIAEITKAFV